MSSCSYSSHVDRLRVVKKLAQGCKEIKGHSGDLDQAARPLRATTSSGLDKPSLPNPSSCLSSWQLISPLPGHTHLCAPSHPKPQGPKPSPPHLPRGFPPLLSAPFLFISPLLAPPLSRQICLHLSCVQSYTYTQTKAALNAHAVF